MKKLNYISCLITIFFINISSAETNALDYSFEPNTVQNHTFLRDVNNQAIISEYKKFFRNEKIAQKYLNKVSMLPVDDQITMFKAFSLGKDVIDKSWKPRMIFVVKLYGIFNSKNRGGVRLHENKLKPFFEKEATLTSQEFKDFLVEDITKYDKKMEIELAKVIKNITELDKDNARLDKDNARLDKDNARLDKRNKAAIEGQKRTMRLLKLLGDATKEKN